jgi:hypothetical protein
MTREEVQKLLGGYATGTLTEDEQQALFAAALEDQQIFDALANEQSLRDLLRDPAAKAAALAALDRPPARAGWLAWMRQPWVAGLAMAGIAAVSIAVWKAQRTTEPEPQLVAKVEPAPAPPAGTVPTVPPPPAPMPDARQALSHDGAPREEMRRREQPAKPMAPPPPPAAPVVAPAQAQPADAADLKAKQDKDSAAGAPAVVAESNKVAPLQLAKEQQQAGALQNAQNAAPSPMAQNMTNFAQQQQQQGFRQTDAPPVFGTQNGLLDRVDVSGGGRGGKGSAKKAEAVAAALKISVVRSNQNEADAATTLAAGEAVKLRVVPNADGFLYVMEGNTTLANAQVKAHQQFETQELKSDAAGQRQFRVILSSTPIPPGVAGVIGGIPQASTRAVLASEKAKVAPPQTPVQQSVTLTWR